MAIGGLKSKSWLWGGVALVVAVGICVVAAPYVFPPKVSLVAFPPLSYPGFQTWPTPRDFDGPGTLFVLDGDYLDYRGSLPVTVTAGDETLVAIQNSGKWSGAVFAKFLGAANSTIESKQDLDVNLTTEGAQRWRANPDELRAAIQAREEKLHTANLYVVTEAISVTRLHYVVGSALALSGDVGVTPAQTDANVKISAKKSDDGKWLLDGNYSKPHYLFYRASKSSLLQGLDKPQIVLIEAQNPLRWTTEHRGASNQ